MKTKYINVYSCVNCKQELSYGMMMSNGGRCPMCGYKGKYAGTIVDVEERAYKITRINPWWKFWKQQYKREIIEEN